MEPEIIITLITSVTSIIVAVIVGIFTYINNKRIGDLEEEVDALQEASAAQKKVIRRLKKYLIEWWEGIQALLNQIICLGHEPVWQPEQPPELEEEE